MTIQEQIRDLEIRIHHAIKAENWVLAGKLQEQKVKLEAKL